MFGKRREGEDIGGHAAETLDGAEPRPPRPPDFLIDRVTPGVSSDNPEPDRIDFDVSGKRSVHEIKMALAGIGRTFGDFGRILDFGCGPARVVRWLQYELPSSTDLHCCDIDEQAIEWNRENLPGISFTRNDFEPPLPYPDEHFDLVLNHSVFTHIDERMQDLWLAELRRVLKPDGVALLSVHGPWAFGISEDHLRSEGDTAAVWRRELERNGLLFVADDAYVGSSFPSYYHTTFHAPWYVFDHWSQWFTVRAYLSRADLGFQDMVLLERDAGDARIRPVAASGHQNGPVTRGQLADDQSSAASISSAATDRMPPVVGAALDRLGQRVNRLEAAVADRLTAGEARS